MLRVGIVGSGFGLYGQLPAFHSLKNCTVVSVCASNQEQLSKHYYSLGLKNVYSDWRKMLDNEDLDALAIAVTPKAQYEIAKVAITRGLHVFAEKPLADSYKHAQILANLAQKHQIISAVDFIFPEIDAWIKVKQLLDGQKYGQLRQLSVNWDFLSYDIKNQRANWKTDSKSGGGALAFYFSHGLYYLEHFAGEISQVKSQLSYSKNNLNGAETGVDLLLRFKNGVSGSAHISCNTVGLNRHQLIFSCEKATITLENKDSFVSNFQITIYPENYRKMVMLKKAPTSDDAKSRVLVVRKIASRFVLACQKNQPMRPSIQEGLRVQQLIEVIKAQNRKLT